MLERAYRKLASRKRETGMLREPVQLQTADREHDAITGRGCDRKLT
jgi:hypothetical protein